MSISPETEGQKRSRARHVFGVPGMVLIVAVILGGFFGAAYYVGSYLGSGQMAAVISATLVDLTNADRKSEDLGTLTINKTLTEAAQAKADDMAAKGYFAHVSPDGHEPWYWFTQAGYDYAAAGENLAVNFSESDTVESAWMNSPEHRANILNGRYTEIGIATAVGEYKGKKTTFVVQLFGTPRAIAASKTGSEDIKETVPSNPEELAVTTRVPAASAVVAGMATVTPSQPVTASEPSSVLAASTPEAPWYSGLIDRLLVSPGTMLRILYILCGALVIVALVLDTDTELKRHHARNAMVTAFFLVLMAGLLVTADHLIFVDPIVAGASVLVPIGS